MKRRLGSLLSNRKIEKEQLEEELETATENSTDSSSSLPSYRKLIVFTATTIGGEWAAVAGFDG